MSTTVENAPAKPLTKQASNVLDFFWVWLTRHLNLSPPALPILVLMVTDKCNLKCKMCGACDYTPGDHDMMNLDQWKAVVDSAEELRTQVISITGGEAMLRKDLFELIAYCRDKGMAVHLNTNGLLLRDKNVAALTATGVETVSISIESTDPEIHDTIRGKGTFEHTLKGVRKLRAAAPEIKIGLNNVMSKHNIDSLPEMVRFAEREGLNQVKFAPIHSNLQHKDKPITDYEDMIFTEEDIPQLNEKIGEIKAALAGTDLESCSDRFFAGMETLYRQPASNFYCYAGYAITVVNPQGEVSACFDKEACNNVRQKPLHEIWRSREFQQHRQLVRNCAENCWDTTNAEMSLRLSFRNLLKEPVKTYRAVRYYLDEKREGASRAAKYEAPRG